MKRAHNIAHIDRNCRFAVAWLSLHCRVEGAWL
ncbi:hypothetical protein GGQ90_000687 [Sphingobium scionense]|uniref:Uncharacterized protein n=1 Tax=Sphingobium scionense TaxID=1404341 RepID=A0A7W6LPC7_9SPHN|nr:hypothetical protein [Sphingobium scionense]